MNYLSDVNSGTDGGAVAVRDLTNATLDMDNFCIENYIKNFLISVSMSSTNAAAVEYVTRPLYCLFSKVVKDLQDKKVI